MALALDLLSRSFGLSTTRVSSIAFWAQSAYTPLVGFRQWATIAINETRLIACKPSILLIRLCAYQRTCLSGVRAVRGQVAGLSMARLPIGSGWVGALNVSALRLRTGGLLVPARGGDLSFSLRDCLKGRAPPFLFCMLAVRRALFPIGRVVPFPYPFGACVRWAYPSCARRSPLAIAHFFFLACFARCPSFLLTSDGGRGGVPLFSSLLASCSLCPLLLSLCLERLGAAWSGLAVGRGLSASRRRLTFLLGPRRPWPVGVKPFYHSYLSNLDRRPSLRGP